MQFEINAIDILFCLMFSFTSQHYIVQCHKQKYTKSYTEINTLII